MMKKHMSIVEQQRKSLKKSIFASLLLKMHQVLQNLQETNHFAEIIKSRTFEAGSLAPQGEKKKKMSISIKSGKFKRTMM